MPLPSSGNSISLYQMADYATDANLDNDADTSGGISLNDAVIRALIEKTAGTTMSFSEWHGAAGVPAKNIAVTVGSGTYFYNTWTGHQDFTGATLGSASVSSINSIYLPINYRAVYHSTGNGGQMNFRVNQGSNSDFVMSKITCGGQTFTRSTATYVSLSNSNHLWYWNNVGSTPFSSAGTLTIVKWYIGS
jgi:hypothetical protein